MRNSLTLITITGALLLGGSPAQAAPVITDLGTLPGNHLSWANDIGLAGVVGASSTPSQVQAVFWPNGGAAVRLQPTAAGWATAEAINGNGVVVGQSGDQAVRWASPGAAPTVLSSPAVYTKTVAKSINDKGVVAGNGDHPETYRTRALRWSSSRPPRVLPPLPGHQESSVGSSGALGEDSVVVGNSDGVAVFWDAGGAVHRLPQLDGWARSEAHAVNRHGVIVGSYDLPGGGGGAVRWERGRVTVLPHLPGTDHSVASSINDAGVAVGASSGRAVRWDAAGAATELPKLSDQLPGHAKAINERGEVAGTNSPVWRQDHAVRWTP